MKKNENRIAAITAAENVGSAISAADKLKAAVERIEISNNEYVIELLKAYIGGNRFPLKVSELKGITAENGAAADVYKAAMLKLWANAIDWVDHDTEATDTATFTAWQEYLQLFGAPAAKNDRKRIAAVVLKATTEGLAYERHKKDNGETVAQMTRGIKSATTASLAPFTKAIEVFAAERVLNFDGVVSRAKAREIAKANAIKKEETLVGVSIEKPAADTTEKRAKKPAKKATEKAESKTAA